MKGKPRRWPRGLKQLVVGGLFAGVRMLDSFPVGVDEGSPLRFLWRETPLLLIWYGGCDNERSYRLDFRDFRGDEWDLFVHLDSHSYEHCTQDSISNMVRVLAGSWKRGKKDSVAWEFWNRPVRWEPLQ